MKRTTILHILFLLIPCILTVIFSIVYFLKFYSQVQPIVINILCILLMGIELANAFTQKINIWKACGFIGSGVISGIGEALNLFSNIKGEKFSLGWWSFWNWLWFGLLVISIISLIIILIRMLRWDQKQWEEIRILKQEYRKEYFKFYREWRSSQQKYKQELAKEKANARIRKQKDKTEKDSIVRNEKHKQRIECIKNCPFFLKSKKETINEETDNTGTNKLEKENSNKLLSSVTIIILLVAVVLFIAIPYSKQLQFIAFSWVDAVKELALKLNIIQNKSNDEYDTFLEAFANYIASYILIIVAICLIGYICLFIYRTIMHKKKLFDNEKSLLQLYDTPIAVLAVFLSFLLAMGSGASLLDGVTSGWGYMFIAILYVLVALVSVEIVRIVLEQIWQDNSLLKRIIKIIFISVLEFFSGLILGVIINFKIEDVISSLISIVFPQEEISFTNRIQEKFNEMFNKELDDNDHNDSIGLGFSQRYIWRRYHKK